MSQIGFVIITHTAPTQLVRLIEALNLVYSYPPIVVHHDFDQCPAELSLPSNVRVVQPHIPTQWCNYSVVRATLAGLALLYADHDKPDWFALLSGACYPTKCAQDVISDLQEGGCDAYIDHQLIDPTSLRGAYQHECFRRYFGWRIGLPRLSRQITPPLLAALFSPYSTNGCRCYAGSEWFTANRRVAEYILAWEGKYSWLGKHLRNRHCPDETYFQTVLCNAPQFRLSRNDYRFIDWSLEGPHPKLLELHDLPSILGSAAHFARKFAPNSSLLSRLDQHLGLCRSDLSRVPKHPG
jgi:Core-2/I-Branching enzyme